MLLLDNVLEHAMAGMTRDRHVAVFLKLGVVAARLLGNAVAEETSG